MNRATLPALIAYLLDSFIKSGAVFAAVSFSLYWMRRESASQRFRLVFSGLSLMTLLMVLALFPISPRFEEGVIALSYADPGVSSSGIAVGNDAFNDAGTASAILSDAGNGSVRAMDAYGVIAIIWLAGMVLIVLYRMAGKAFLWFALAKTVSVTDERMLGIVKRAIAALAIRHAVAVKTGDRIERPFVAGILKPTVYLPPASREWSEGQSYSVLCHELAHVKRSDLGLFAVARLFVLALWYSPFAWMLLRFIRQYREEACDEGAIRAGIRPSAYADWLLSASLKGSTKLPFSLVAEVGYGRSLERRIERTLSPAIGKSSRLKTAFVFSSLLLFVLILVPIKTVWAEEPKTPAVEAPVVMERYVENVTIGRSRDKVEIGFIETPNAGEHLYRVAIGSSDAFPLGHPFAGASFKTSLSYGMQTNPFTSLPFMHEGIDLAARSGESVKATMDGTIRSAGFDPDYGYFAEIQKGNFAVFYAHLVEASSHTEGETVAAGDQIGRVGSTGTSTGPHLHYEVRVYENGSVFKLNPNPFLEAAKEHLEKS